MQEHQCARTASMAEGAFCTAAAETGTVRLPQGRAPLPQVAQYHIVPGRALAIPDFNTGDVLQTLLPGQSLQVPRLASSCS